MRVHFAATAVLLVLAWCPVSGAKADPYRWCAEGIGQSGSSNCYFITLEQCKAAASGLGAFCVHNNFYTGPDQPSRPRARRR